MEQAGAGGHMRRSRCADSIAAWRGPSLGGAAAGTAGAHGASLQASRAVARGKPAAMTCSSEPGYLRLRQNEPAILPTGDPRRPWHALCFYSP
jgi:hypothetical protein